MEDKKRFVFMTVIIPIITVMFFFGLIVFIETSLLLLSSFALAENHQHADNKHVDHDEHEGRYEHDRKRLLRISKEEMEEFSIKLATAGPGKMKRYVELPGEIVPDPERLAHMIPRFPGVVQEIRKQIGDKVAQDEVLAIIENNESLVPYEVRSLINGVVMDIHLTRGEVTGGALGSVGVTVDKQQGFIIADLSTVWVNLSVYQKDVPYVHVGNEVTIYAGLDIPETVGEISYVTPFLNKKTRTATARVILSNLDGYWKPGLFVTGRVTTDEIEADILVPKSAIQTMDEKSVVFIEIKNGFMLQPVIIGRANATHVEIISGLRPGQRYVSKNGFTLKAELMKSEFGEGHSH
ncbi:MAG: efflux RND transporter periplasmic adaptor subunit [Candidatus Anammoxibacter sp.]